MSEVESEKTGKMEPSKGDMLPSESADKIPFEEALDQTGFGVYNVLHTLITGLVIISYACIAYGASIIVPTSACELQTTAGQQGAMASAPQIAAIFGALAWGYLGDTRGRRRMLLVSLALALAANSLAALSVHWTMLLALQFLATLVSSGQFTLSITLLSESVPLARRNLVLLLVSSIFLLSQGVMAVMAIPIIPLPFSHYLPGLGIYWNSWRTVMLVYSLPSLLSILCLALFVEESPKFLLAKQREGEALDVLRVILRRNRLSAKADLKVNGLIPEEKKSEAKPKIRDQFVPLFQPPLLKYTLLVGLLYLFKQVNAFLIWMPRILDQFVQVAGGGGEAPSTLCGIIRAALQQPPDPEAVPCALDETALLLVLAVAASQSLVNAVLSLIVNRTGRRNMVVGLTAVAGVSGLLVNLVPNAVASVVLFIVYLQGIIVLGLYTAISVALFPTHLRAMAVSVTLTSSRVATFAAIQILNLMLESNCEAGFYVFASIFTSSAIVAMFLPDDRLLGKGAPAPGPQGAVSEGAVGAEVDPHGGGDPANAADGTDTNQDCKLSKL